MKRAAEASKEAARSGDVQARSFSTRYQQLEGLSLKGVRIVHVSLFVLGGPLYLRSVHREFESYVRTWGLVFRRSLDTMKWNLLHMCSWHVPTPPLFRITTNPLQVTSKPTESMDEITRPSKRGKSGKGAAAGGSGAQEEEEEDEEEDVEMVGTKGGSELPHNRFDCPEVRTYEFEFTLLLPGLLVYAHGLPSLNLPPQSRCSILKHASCSSFFLSFTVPPLATPCWPSARRHRAHLS